MYRSDRVTAATVDVATQVVVARIEAEAPPVVRAAHVDRTRPVAAKVANVVELVVQTIARSGQEETVAVRGGEEPAVHAVPSHPGDGRVVFQFLPLRPSGHAPVIAPVGCGCVVLGQQSGQVVGEAVVAIIGIGAVLGQLIIIAVDILVSTPVVSGFRLGLTPSKIITIAIGGGGTHIAGGPQGTTRQTKVNVGMRIGVAAVVVTAIVVRFVVFSASSGNKHH